MRPTVQSILQQAFSKFVERHRLPLYQWKAARAMMRCRTAALGGHVRACPKGHVERVWYNSCRHRACPQCNFGRIEEWLETHRRQLLPCDHFHLIFTLPSELRPLWRWNRRVMADLLFAAVRSTLFGLLSDPKFLAAKPGYLAALHTWSRKLALHPHLHCLITAGGLDPAGRWKSVRKGFLLPIKAVKARYRGIFLHLLEQRLRRGELTLPDGWTHICAQRCLEDAACHEWSVRIEEPYEHGEGVATYLARYFRGGPIKNGRILRADAASVSFRYHDLNDLDAEGRPRAKTLTLATEEFLRRLFEHLPQPRQHVVRAYGLYARTAAADRERCREQLSTDGSRATARESANKPRSPTPAERCPVCGRLLVRTRDLPRTRRAPPLLPALESKKAA